MKTRRSVRCVLLIGLCIGLPGGLAANNFGLPTGQMQPGLYRVEGRVLNAQAGGPAAASREAVQHFQTAMSSALSPRRVCFTQNMTSRGASAVVTEGGEGCSFEATREDSSGFEGNLRCPGDSSSDRPSKVAGRIYNAAADYTMSSTAPMMVGQNMSQIVFRVRYIATRVGEC